MKKSAVVLAACVLAAMATPTYADDLNTAWFGAGVRYTSHGQPVYVYLPGLTNAPTSPQGFPYAPGYAYVSDYYPPRYFEPALAYSTRVVRVRHVRHHRKVRCRCST